jgi:hypothetical protein
MCGEPPPDRVSRLLTIAKDACKSAEAQYDDYYRSFVGLDGKAQAAGTVAGVVLAALFAFVNASHSAAIPLPAPRGLHILLFGSSVGALLTVIISIIAMRVRDAVTPFAATEQITEAEDLADLPASEISSDRILLYYRGRLTHLKMALGDMSRHITIKGRWALTAQIVLISTLALLLALFLVIIEQDAGPHSASLSPWLSWLLLS